ncbi:MAG: helix-turn-helix domain-containing protein [Trebonia sp.]|jgi:AcrR family transcriptional regulator|uniref:TetR/AcrR family transcriptional regulator n=1 Tax=Trebonia sp. TaxID=2767075 RepID=UPI003BAFF315
MARPTTAKLDQARIRAAALALVDAEGLDRLSMRRLATALDVSAASLYFHYATKDELLEAVAADILANVDTSAFSSGWEPGVRAWARSLRAALAAHPRLVPVLSHAPGRRADALQRADDIQGGLVAAGWPPREATMIGAAAKYLVFGAALGSFAEGFAADPEVYADRYPHLGQAHRLAARAAEVDRESFDFALEQLIAGLRARYAREMS